MQKIDVEILSELLNDSLCYEENNPNIRALIADVCRKHQNISIGRTVQKLTNSKWCERLSQLQSDGIVSVGELLSFDKVEQIKNYFENQFVYARHHPYGGDLKQQKIEDVGNEYSFASYDAQQVLSAPFLFELARRKELLDFAEVYLDAIPTVYSIHVFWSLPGRPVQGPQDFHRDMECFASCALMLFLCDVDEFNGPHEYIAGSFSPDTALQRAIPKVLATLSNGILDTFLTTPPDGYGHRELFKSLFSGSIVQATASQGNGFFINPYGLHSGVPPADKPRLMCWIRYGVMPTAKSPAYNLALAEDTRIDKAKLSEDLNDREKYSFRFYL